MIRFKEVPEGLLVELTDKELLLQEYPDLNVGLYEVMEYSDFAPEGTKSENWSDISGTIGIPAIGYGVYEYSIGELGIDIEIPNRMFEYKKLADKNIFEELIENGLLLFTPFEFKTAEELGR